MSLVYTAQSKHHFYCRDVVCEYVFRQGAVPLNPFRAFDYFLGDRVPRELIREGNQRLISAADEMWVFGSTLADGVIVEIALAGRLGLPIRFFTIATDVSGIEEIAPAHLDFEVEVLKSIGSRAVELRDRVRKGDAEILVQALGRFDEVIERI